MIVESVEPVPHGGDLDAARRQYPHAPEPWIDLSTGINPVAYPVTAPSLQAWSRLPLAGEEAGLRQAAAVRYGAADPAMIVTAAGTQALIQVLPGCFARTRRPRVAILGPTYAEHGRAWRRAGGEVRDVATLAQADDADVVVVVNPDNPTGELVSVDDLVACAARLRHRCGLLVVDEAFIDVAAGGASLVPRLPPSTLVLRSFGKTYGLAGLRLGFAVANIPLASQLRDIVGPWAASGPAIEIGRRALDDTAWLDATAQRLATDVARLDRMLAAAGCRLVGGTALFRLVSHEGAWSLADRLGAAGLHVRRFDHQPTWLRFGLPGATEAWDRLAIALADGQPLPDVRDQALQTST